MGKSHRQQQQKRKASQRGKAITWIVVAALAALFIYGVSQMSGIAYTERDLEVVNFSGLDSRQKRQALEAANSARCTCGCGLGLAQCVATDLTCPIRETNIDLIKGMVREALAQPSS